MMNKVVTEVSEYKIIRADEENVKIIRAHEENVKIIRAGSIGEKGETGAGVAQGGSIGEILTKSSVTDYDTEWQSTSDLNIALTSNNLSDMADLDAVKQNLNLVAGQDVQAYSDVLENTTASFTSAEKSKLAGIESNATGDQSSSDIIALLNDDPSFNLFTDAYRDKLDDLEVVEYLGVPQFTDYNDVTYFYFGWSSVNGGWLIQRQLRSTGASVSATITSNSSYATLIDAWTDRATITYV